MLEIKMTPGENSAEFVLPKGCLQCEGDVAVKVSPWGTRGFCDHCHTVVRAVVSMKGGVVKYGAVTDAAA